MRTPVHRGFGSTRRARERAAREAAILEAAERVIARRGFHEAGMVEIAREAEYAVGTLYTLFESKEALYERLLVTRADEMSREFQAALAGAGSARARLEAALDAKARYFSRHVDFIRLWAPAWVPGRGPSGMPAEVVRLREANVRTVERLAVAARRSGDLPADAAPADVALAFQTLSTAFLVAAIRDGRGVDLGRVRTAMRAVFFDPLFGRAAGGRARPAARRAGR